MIADRTTLDASWAAGEKVARAWIDGADHAALTAAFAGVTGIEAQAVVAAHLLSDIAWIGRLLAPLIAALAGDPWFIPPLRVARDPIRTGAMLFDCPAASLTATVTSADMLARQVPPATVVVAGRVAVTRYVRAGGARLLRWRAGPASRDLSIATAPRAQALPPLALHDGVVVRLDGRSDGHLLDGARDDVVTLSFALRGDRAGYVREYDRESGALLRAAGIEESDSRTHMLLTMLRLIGRTDAGACFERATRAPSFHLRWNAMREWLALDAAAALPRLEAMAATDPNPEIRAAARATCDLVATKRAA